MSSPFDDQPALIRLTDQLRKIAARGRGAGLVVIALAVVAGVWFVGSIAWTVLAVASIAGLIAATWIVVAPDAKAVLGRGDPRPWLVRLREHRWPPVPVPLAGSLPRGWAYALLAVGWWWLFR